jgi:dUTP pyrophosphatase
MKIFKTKKVKTPERNGKNAGIDFFIPSNFKDTILKPNKSIVIESGIKVRLPDNYCLIAFNKSSISLKDIITGACLIDENYTGQIHFNLINVGTNFFELKANQKIAQFVLIKQNYYAIKECFNEQELYKNFNIKERGENGFGSTNK